MPHLELKLEHYISIRNFMEDIELDPEDAMRPAEQEALATVKQIISNIEKRRARPVTAVRQGTANLVRRGGHGRADEVSQLLSTESRQLVPPAESGLKTFGALTLRPAAMVCRSIGICMGLVMARDAAELGLAGTIGF